MEPLYTPTELAEVQAYHAPVYVMAAVELIVWPLLLVLGARFLTRPLYRLAQRLGARVKSAPLERMWGGPEWSTAVIFAIGYLGAFALLTAPIDVWFSFVREHQYGLSTESFGHYLLDVAKAQGLLVVSITALAFGLFGIARRTTRWWWLVGGVTCLLLIVSTAADPYRSKLYLDQSPLPEGALRSRLTTMLQAAQIPFGDIVVVNTGIKSVRVEAAFAGTGPTRTIMLTDTIIDAMTEPEIASAVAHEAGHVNESRWLGRVLTPLAVMALLAFIEWLFRKSSQRGWFGITSRGDIRVLPLVVLVFDLSVTAIAPLSAAHSRSRELTADAFGVALTHDPASMQSLLTRLARINKVDPHPPRWYVLSGVSHPTIAERVDAIQKNATPPPTSPVNAGTSEQQLPGVTR